MDSFNSFMSQQSIGIGITTKDRWDDLSVTLERLRQNGLDRFETIVIDDGSSRQMPPAFLSRFDWVTFERCQSPRGYIAQRNRLAHMLSSELYLSLDDDSYPAPHVGLDQAAAWLIAKRDAVALAFWIHTPSAEHGGSFLRRTERPYPVRYYVGCAHMLKRQLFCRLGGYTQSLYYYCEEIDFALKAWNHGFDVYKYPAVVVIHDKSPAGRDSESAIRFFTRNRAWIFFWRCPFPLFVLKLFSHVPLMLRHKGHRAYWKFVFQGYFEACIGLARVAKYRNPLTLRRYIAWLKKPLDLQ